MLGPSMQVAFNHSPDTLPLRELPHGSWSELYLLYKAFVESKATGDGKVQMASRSTFFAEAQRWHVCLKFHQKHTMPNASRVAACELACKIQLMLDICNGHEIFKLKTLGKLGMEFQIFKLIFPPLHKSTLRILLLLRRSPANFYITTPRLGVIVRCIG